MFCDHKRYRLDNLIYMQIMFKMLVVCETTEVPVINYKTKNLTNQMSFSIQFLYNDNGLLYLVMKNIYPAFIIRFVFCLITILNRKLYTATFCELFCLILTFLLSPSCNFQLSLPSFCKLLPNLHEIIAAFQLVLKVFMIPCVLNLSYSIPTETATTNEAIAAAMLEYMAKATNNKNKHL